MKVRIGHGCGLLTLAAAFALAAAGCGQAANEPEAGTDAKKAGKGIPVAQKEGIGAEEGAEHNYKGRDWCPEHGIPESICSMCDAKVAAERKKAGDWCAEHDRAKSQCFVCNPKLKEKFAAEYRAKYGEDPPPTEDEEKKDGDKPQSEGKK